MPRHVSRASLARMLIVMPFPKNGKMHGQGVDAAEDELI